VLKLAKLEYLLKNIKQIASKLQYPFWEDNDRLKEILSLIEEADRENN